MSAHHKAEPTSVRRLGGADRGADHLALTWTTLADGRVEVEAATATMEPARLARRLQGFVLALAADQAALERFVGAPAGSLDPAPELPPQLPATPKRRRGPRFRFGG